MTLGNWHVGFPTKIKNSFNLPQLLVIFINEILLFDQSNVRSKYMRHEDCDGDEFQTTEKRISSSQRVIAS